MKHLMGDDRHKDMFRHVGRIEDIVNLDEARSRRDASEYSLDDKAPLHIIKCMTEAVGGYFLDQFAEIAIRQFCLHPFCLY